MPPLPSSRPQALADVQMHRLTLAFSRPDVEAAFLEEYAARSLFQVRLGIGLGVGLVAAYGLLDAHIMPDAVEFVRWIRFGLLVPLLLVGLALAYSRHALRILQALPATLAIVTGAGIVAMTLKAGPPATTSTTAASSPPASISTRSSGSASWSRRWHPPRSCCSTKRRRSSPERRHLPR